MKRYFDLNKLTDNNFCDDIDQSFMVEISDDGKPYELVDGDVICISDTQEYKEEQLEIKKSEKLTQLLEKSNAKKNDLTATITINLPATLKKGDEIKNVTSYKLLTNTSSGNILQALQLLNTLPTAFITDSLVTDDGYTVVGLSHEVTVSGLTGTQAYLILCTAIQVQGAITLYLA